MIKAQLVSLGARIPADLKRIVANYCDRNGIKLQFFITEAIREKLAEIHETELDNKIVDERMQNPQLMTKADFEKYIQKRKTDRSS